MFTGAPLGHPLASDTDAGLNACSLGVQEDGEAWVTLFTDQCSGTYTYDADCGHAYNFRVTATDNRGNFASAEVGVNVLRVTKYYYAAGRRIAMRRHGRTHLPAPFAAQGRLRPSVTTP